MRASSGTKTSARIPISLTDSPRSRLVSFFRLNVIDANHTLGTWDSSARRGERSAQNDILPRFHSDSKSLKRGAFVCFLELFGCRWCPSLRRLFIPQEPLWKTGDCRAKV